MIKKIESLYISEENKKRIKELREGVLQAIFWRGESEKDKGFLNAEKNIEDARNEMEESTGRIENLKMEYESSSSELSFYKEGIKENRNKIEVNERKIKENKSSLKSIEFFIKRKTLELEKAKELKDPDERKKRVSALEGDIELERIAKEKSEKQFKLLLEKSKRLKKEEREYKKEIAQEKEKIEKIKTEITNERKKIEVTEKSIPELEKQKFSILFSLREASEEMDARIEKLLTKSGLSGSMPLSARELEFLTFDHTEQKREESERKPVSAFSNCAMDDELEEKEIEILLKSFRRMEILLRDANKEFRSSFEDLHSDYVGTISEFRDGLAERLGELVPDLVPAKRRGNPVAVQGSFASILDMDLP